MEGVINEIGLAISEDPSQADAIRPEALFELAKGVFSIALEESPAYSISIRVDEDDVLRINDGSRGRHKNNDRRTEAIERLIEQITQGETAQYLRGLRPA